MIRIGSVLSKFNLGLQNGSCLCGDFLIRRENAQSRDTHVDHGKVSLQHQISRGVRVNTARFVEETVDVGTFLVFLESVIRCPDWKEFVDHKAQILGQICEREALFRCHCDYRDGDLE
jgi:hypothetical protein